MKLSVSLSGDDLAVLDHYVQEAGLTSRSAGVQRAIGMLRHPGLEQDYGNAWAEWSAAEAEKVWDNATGDGFADAAR